MMTKKMRLTFLITTFISFLVSIVLTIQLLGSLLYYQSIITSNSEIYRATSYSPYAKLEPWEDIKKDIQEDYADENWSLRLVSGNLDTDVSIIICISIGTLFVYSICGVYYISYLYKKVSKKGRRA